MRRRNLCLRRALAFQALANREAEDMNNIFWIIGVVVVVIAILSFAGVV
jgi:hypothetical protein